MPLYQYQAIDSQGKKRSGVIEGMGEQDVKSRLREQGVMVTTLSVKKKTSSKENLKGDNLVTFTVQLAQLVGAGVPLYQSIVALEEQSREDPYHRILLGICENIKSGVPLSVAMANYPGSFDRLYCGMIAAGESSGALELVLDKLAILLTKRNQVKKQIATAMIYPAILVSFSFLVILLLLGFVVPSIEGIFKDQELNAFTALVLGVSHFLQDYWWIYLPTIAGVVTYSVIKLRSPAGQLWLERNLIKVPLVRTLMIQASIARFSRTMSTLLIGGLTMIESLRIAREVMRNVVLEKEIKQAEDSIIEGSSLSVELSKSQWFPKMVSRMLSVGEDSGTITVMLGKIADMYEAELEKTVDWMMAMAQPVILIFMGVFIGMILLAILLPLTNLSSF